MRFTITKYSSLMIALLIFSCKKVININLNNAAPKIVIQGNITNSSGPYLVQITQTVNFSAANVFPPLSGAVVKISDNTVGLTDSLIEVSPGIYSTHTLRGVSGHTYQLNILALGKTYTALSTMPQPVLLDSINFIYSNLFGVSNIDAVVNFQDPPNISNYYTFTEFVNNRQLANTYVFSDRLSDGKYISQEIVADSAYVKRGDTVLIQMNCVDKNVWGYYSTLGLSVTGNNPQSLSPANPVSNISNNALGYFNACTSNIKIRIAE